MQMIPLARFVLALAIGSVGALIFAALNLPLAWMLGSMVFCTIAALLRAPIKVTPEIRPYVMSVIGVALAGNVDHDTFSNIVAIAPSMAGLLLCTLLSALVSVFYYWRIARNDIRTALLSGMPGGLAEMVALSHQYDADTQRIALAHSTRVLLIVFSLPVIILLAGDFDPGVLASTQPRLLDTPIWIPALTLLLAFVGMRLGRLIRLPAGDLTGPMLITIVLRATGILIIDVPLEMILCAQLFLGTMFGSGFAGTSPILVVKSIGLSLGSTVLLLAITIGTALGISTLSGLDFRVLVLSYAPGGLSETSILALMLSADAAIVALHHIARLIIVLLIAAMAMGWISSRQNRADAQGGENREGGATPSSRPPTQ